jgi:uncharacterized protein
MTPQESELVAELFDRLAKLETTPRDPDAERLIADGTRQAPHALYALVQTTLLQDEALKRANARIEELRAQVNESPQPGQRQGSFLDSMRATFGGGEPRGSVPSVRAQNAPPPSAPPPGYPSQNFQSQPGYPPPPPPGYAGGPAFGSGGSFLGTAASTAAGVIGGSLLLDGIRSMFGHHLGGNPASAFGDLGGERASPWAANASGGAADSQLARDAGINHIGDHANDPIANAGNDQSAAADDSIDADDADDDTMADDNDFDDDDFADDDFADDDGMSDDSSDV